MDNEFKLISLVKKKKKKIHTQSVKKKDSINCFVCATVHDLLSQLLRLVPLCVCVSILCLSLLLSPP